MTAFLTLNAINKRGHMHIRNIVLIQLVFLFTFSFSQTKTVILRQSNTYKVKDVLYDWFSFVDGSQMDWGWFQTCYT